MSKPANNPGRTRPPEDPWHAITAEKALGALNAQATGLSTAEAAARLQRYGPNRIPTAGAPPWWRILLRQFVSPLIAVLALAAVLSIAIGDLADAGFIAAVMVLNAIIGGLQEWRAERSAHALRTLLTFRAAVQRDSEVSDVDAADIVPGDLLWLESGYRVPADARLLSENGLETDESLLTGESLVVDKDAAWLGPESTPLADRLNMVHAGTTVVRGRATALVVATGESSSAGRLAIDVLGAPPGRPPLLVRLDRFSRILGLASILVAGIVVILGVSLYDHDLSHMALFGVALVVAIIPEGLPVAITIALAVASSRLARRGVIVRRLGAVEGLGSCTLIASDKTGTLTCNELTVREVRLTGGERFEVTGEGFAPRGELPGLRAGSPDLAAILGLARAAVLCNEGDLHQRDGDWVWRGDPTDIALLALAHKLGVARASTLEQHPQVNAIPFEAEHRFAASFNRDRDALRVHVKGAPERVLAMCAGGQSLAPLRAAAEDMAASGMRVLAIADGLAPEGLGPGEAPPQPSGLRCLGLVGMIDPARAGAAEAVAACTRAGVGVCMVTGDHPTTALTIARSLNIADSPDEVVTGAALESMTDEALRSAMADNSVRVFARAAPHQKLRIVGAARDVGHFVAVTGDGANDAPALCAAHIGVAMGRSGTDIARDASDLVVSDDNFATIVAGIEEGRVAYDNIRKVIYFLVSTSGAEVVVVTLAVAFGLPLPLLPVQLLWLNLVTQGMQHVALAFERKEDDILARPPRPPN